MIEKLIELLKPYMNKFLCENESGSCEFVKCEECRGRELAEKLIENGVLLPPCKVGDYVKFTGNDEIWRVDCLHFYREGQPQISITRENVTDTITLSMFVKFGEKVICRKQEESHD